MITCVDRLDLHRGDEPVAHPRHRLDAPRRVHVIAECRPDLLDAARERVLGDGDAGPERVEQFGLGDEMPGALHQEAQRLEGLGGQVDVAAVDVKAAFRHVEDEACEPVPGLAVRHEGHRDVVGFGGGLQWSPTNHDFITASSRRRGGAVRAGSVAERRLSAGHGGV